MLLSGYWEKKQSYKGRIISISKRRFYLRVRPLRAPLHFQRERSNPFLNARIGVKHINAIDLFTGKEKI